MQVTDIFQRAGDAEFTLRSPPAGVLTDLTAALGASGDPTLWGPRDGLIAVASGPVPPLEMGLDKAVWAGTLTRSDDRFGFRCRHIDHWLGTSNMPGPFRIIAPFSRTGANMAQVAADFITWAGSPFTANVTEPGGTIDYTWPTGTTYAEMLDYCVAQFPTRSIWRSNPDFSVDIGTATAIQYPSAFVTTPGVLVTPEPIADFATFGVTRGIRGRARRAIDAESVAHAATAFGQPLSPGPGYITRTATSSRNTTRDPINGTEMPTTLLVDNSQAQNNTEADNAALARLRPYESPRDEFTVECDASANAQQFVKRGDKIWIYDAIGQVWDETNPRSIRSVDIFPLEVTVVEIDWSVPEEYGIWLLRHNGATQVWREITQWVEPSNRPTVLTVSRDAGVLDTSAGRTSRFHPSIAERIDS